VLFLLHLYDWQTFFVSGAVFKTDQRTVWVDDGVFLERKGGDVQDVSTGPLFGADLKGAFSSEFGPLGVGSKKM